MERRFNETELAGNQINGIHDIIRLEGEKLLLVGLVIELGQGDDGGLGIDIPEPGGHHIGFILSQRGMEGAELTVEIGQAYGIVVHQGNMPNTGPAQRFCRIAAHAANAEHHHVLLG